MEIPVLEPGNGVTFVLGMGPASSLAGSDHSSMSSSTDPGISAFSECEEYKDIVESVLEEEVQFEEGELTENMRPTARFG